MTHSVAGEAGKGQPSGGESAVKLQRSIRELLDAMRRHAEVEGSMPGLLSKEVASVITVYANKLDAIYASGPSPFSDVLAALADVSPQRSDREDAEILRHSNIIEIAVRNQTGSVSEYMKHWEGRALKAEAELESLRSKASPSASVQRMIRSIKAKAEELTRSINDLGGEIGKSARAEQERTQPPEQTRIQRAAWCGNSFYHDDYEQGRFDDRCGACRRSLAAIELLLIELRKDAAPAASGWQPIETAPTDGTEILLTDGHYKRTGYWAKRIGAWSVDTVVTLAMPTHWAPLPAASGSDPEKREG